MEVSSTVGNQLLIPNKRCHCIRLRELLTFFSNAAIPLMIGVITLSIAIHQQNVTQSNRDKDAAQASELRAQDLEQARIQREEDKIIARLQRTEDKENTRLQRELDLEIANDKRFQDNELAEQQRNSSENLRLREFEMSQYIHLHNLMLEDERQKESILFEYENDLATLLLDYESNVNDQKKMWWFVFQMKTGAALRQLDPARRSILTNTLWEANLLDLNVSEEISLLYSSNVSGVQFGFPLTYTEGYHEIDGHLVIAESDIRYASFSRIFLSNSPSFIDSNLDYTDWSFALLSNLHFKGHMTMNEAKFNGAEIISTTFNKVKMNRASFEYNSKCIRCRFIRTSLIGIRLNHSNFVESTFSSLTMIDGNLSNGSFTDSTFEDASLDRIDLSRANLKRCHFEKISMIDCYMYETIFDETKFSKVNLTGCKGLTKEQISTKIILYQTTLPNGTYIARNRN